jgi:hypothetical protein
MYELTPNLTDHNQWRRSEDGRNVSMPRRMNQQGRFRPNVQHSARTLAKVRMPQEQREADAFSVVLPLQVGGRGRIAGYLPLAHATHTGTAGLTLKRRRRSRIGQAAQWRHERLHQCGRGPDLVAISQCTTHQTGP